jgi:hypothetical protein
MLALTHVPLTGFCKEVEMPSTEWFHAMETTVGGIDEIFEP